MVMGKENISDLLDYQKRGSKGPFSLVLPSGIAVIKNIFGA